MKEQYDLINDAPVIRTFMGKWVNVFDPTLDMFDIRDIAHALSHQCRFSGHVSHFYSVAQHSILCYRRAYDQGLNKKEQLTALMHDSSEAYLVDIPRPIKKQFSQYKIIEDKLMLFLSTKFKFNYPLSEDIISIDNLLLQEEWDNLMVQKVKDPLNHLDVYSQEYDEQLFLETYNYLIK